MPSSKVECLLENQLENEIVEASLQRITRVNMAVWNETAVKCFRNWSNIHLSSILALHKHNELEQRPLAPLRIFRI